MSNGEDLEKLLRSWDGHPGPSARRPILHFCPDGRQAAFVITDHGDRTRTEATAAVYLGSSKGLGRSELTGGLMGHGVRITQGTFSSGYDEFDYLDSPDFHGLMMRAHEHGIEVCPHNTSENLLAPEETRADLDRYAAAFGLTTFLDHGHLPSNLTREGCDPDSPYFILNRFRALGGNAAWSFRDVTINPAGRSIDILERRPLGPMLGAIAAEARLAARREPHNLRARVATVVNESIGPLAVYHLLVGLRRSRGRTRLRDLRRAASECLRHRVDSAGLPPFPLHWDSETGLVWFDTIRVNLITKTYTVEAIDHLVDRNGLHLGHTYLGFLEDRHGDISVEPVGDGGWIARPGFETFLAHSESRIADGSLWNPTLRELIAHLRGLAALNLDLNADGCAVDNPSAAPIEDFTIRSQDRLRWDLQAGVREHRRRDEWWYVMSLPAQGRASATFMEN